MLRFIYLVIMAILMADVVEGRSMFDGPPGRLSTRNRRYNLLRKHHKTQKTAHYGTAPKKKFAARKIAKNLSKMLIQRRNFANQLFF